MSTVRSRFKPPKHFAADDREKQHLLAEIVQPISLQSAMTWDVKWRRLLYMVLVPADVLTGYGIDPIRLTDSQNRPVAHATYDETEQTVRLDLYHTADATDAMIELELADTALNQIEVLWLAFQDPYSPRFDIDVMPDGQTTMRGILRRNIEAEEAALAAGLAPGQIRRGLGSFRQLTMHLETFMGCLNQREYVAEPLFYHTAVLFERIGFSYIRGHARMVHIDRGFAPGGELRAKLDGSSPFRMPELADSIRGRAWAIHAGILGQPWDRVRMIKRLGVNAQIDTCPGVPW